MINQLLFIASHSDGVRCDMAMLLLEDVFGKTWGGNPINDEERIEKKFLA
jgi:hypothetical protein